MLKVAAVLVVSCAALACPTQPEQHVAASKSVVDMGRDYYLQQVALLEEENAVLEEAQLEVRNMIGAYEQEKLQQAGRQKVLKELLNDRISEKREIRRRLSAMQKKILKRKALQAMKSLMQIKNEKRGSDSTSPLRLRTYHRDIEASLGGRRRSQWDAAPQAWKEGQGRSQIGTNHVIVRSKAITGSRIKSRLQKGMRRSRGHRKSISSVYPFPKSKPRVSTQHRPTTAVIMAKKKNNSMKRVNALSKVKLHSVLLRNRSNSVSSGKPSRGSSNSRKPGRPRSCSLSFLNRVHAVENTNQP